jgi:transposase
MLIQVGVPEQRPAGEGAGQTCPGKEREASNVRVLPGMIQLAWRFPMFHKQSALVQRYRKQTTYDRGTTRKTMDEAETECSLER